MTRLPPGSRAPSAWQTGHPEHVQFWTGMPFLAGLMALTQPRAERQSHGRPRHLAQRRARARGGLVLLRRLRPLLAPAWWWVIALGLAGFVPLMSTVWWKQFNLIALVLAAAGFALARQPALGLGGGGHRSVDRDQADGDPVAVRAAREPGNAPDRRARDRVGDRAEPGRAGAHGSPSRRARPARSPGRASQPGRQDQPEQSIHVQHPELLAPIAALSRRRRDPLLDVAAALGVVPAAVVGRMGGLGPARTFDSQLGHLRLHVCAVRHDRATRVESLRAHARAAVPPAPVPLRAAGSTRGRVARAGGRARRSRR